VSEPRIPSPGTTNPDPSFQGQAPRPAHGKYLRITEPGFRRLLLVGGGHTHVEVLRRLALRPWPRVQAVLVSPGRFTPYSGMLPGLIAGDYRYDEAHLDLDFLCHRAGAAFIESAALGLDTAAKALLLADGQRLEYDLLFINTGSRPDLSGIAGAKTFGIGVKPVEGFLREWERIRGEAARRRLRIAVVGGGAAGVELVLAMERGLGRGARADFHLVTNTPEILPAHPPAVRRILTRALEQAGIALHCGRAVMAARPGELRWDNGGILRVEEVVWALAASPPAWISKSGLATDTRGFVAVNSQLRSLSHPDVFAAGDTATILHAPRPKAGVYAVRQGPVLAQNLRAALEGRRLASHVPQRRALSLLNTGNHRAVASYGPLALEGAWVWRWKDWIDRRFMARYRAD